MIPRATILANKLECWRAGLSAIFGVPFLGGIKEGVYYGLPPRLGGLEVYKKFIISGYKKYGGKLVAYLPNERRHIQQAIQLGMDAIITDQKKERV